MSPAAPAPEVALFSWNPRRRTAVRRLPARRVNNFGDLLGPLIVRALARGSGRDLRRPATSATLVTVGSVLHLAPAHAVVWGSGVNGKMLSRLPERPELDVRAVRGPRTREVLRSRGVEVPEVYGDPALLLPLTHPELVGRRARHAVTVIPNLNDVAHYDRPFLDPRRRLATVLATVAESRLVVGSSLHAVIVAEALGVPARLVVSQSEDRFKYDDYYGGTGRPDYTCAGSVAEAVELGGEVPPVFDPQPLVDAFPVELWEPSR